MKITGNLLQGLLGILFVLSTASQTSAALLPGYAELSGQVTGADNGVLPVVSAHNTAKDVTFVVFVVNGKYRAINLIPGPYEITIRPAVDQLESFEKNTVKMA